ncbi:MAG: SDR family NAD(P)-dependent oxidoreductase [Planctomycetota bacterium]|nr:SDR family NAD(P)-dependent oxidoreductase [Planctomycetota bacterium]
MSIRGRGAVITGGGRGIGAAIARALHGAGARVVVTARSSDQIRAVADELGGDAAGAFATICDVTAAESVESMARAAEDHLGQVDILVNNAGVASSAPLRSLTIEEWDRVQAINVRGPFLCSREFFAGMLDRGFGRIVNIASVAGLDGAAYISAYAASKHALVGFTRSVAAEGVSRGVTANAICPGYVDTPMTEESVQRIVEKTGMSEEQALEAVVANNPQGRLIQPGEVAELVLSLCQDDAGGINGQAITIDEDA